jgi:hypothetical protein
MDLREIGWEDVEWFQLAQDRGQWWSVVNVMNLRGLGPRSLLDISYSIRSTCPSHLKHRELTMRIIPREEYKLWCS